MDGVNFTQKDLSALEEMRDFIMAIHDLGMTDQQYKIDLNVLTNLARPALARADALYERFRLQLGA